MLTFAGIWEIDPHWVEEHLRELEIVDVREPDEFSGPLGHIPGARLLPLGGLAESAAGLPRDKPIVTVCRAGGRSAQASLTLKKLGFEQVANLPGGMLRWRALRQVVEGGSE
jgi:rhodanese-related sulfurtransferase